MVARTASGKEGRATGTGVPATMRAAVLREPRQMQIATVPTPSPGPGQVLVELEGCGVCASNIPPWEGRPWFTYPLAPGALGHEGWGVISEAGPGVDRFSPGDRVAMISHHAYAEYDVADAAAVIHLPAALDRNPFPAEPLGCAMNIMARAEIRAEETVAIVGIGFIGALLTQLASSAGARVIALSRREDSLEFARSMGARHVIRMDDHGKVLAEVKALAGERWCGVVIEATGKQWPLDLAAEITAERGRLVIAGYHQDGLRQVNMQLWNWRGFDVINAHERDPAVYHRGMQRAVDAVQEGRLHVEPLYTHRFPLSGISTALEMAAERPEGFMKALVTMR